MRPNPTRAAAALSFRNIGAVYVWLVIVVLFSVWAPDTFPTLITVKQVLNGNAVAGLVALSVVLPLAARVFDLSVAYTMSLTSVLTAHFLVSTGLGPFASTTLAMTAALLVGVVNAIVVVILRVDSFIATLATGALIQSLITMVTNDSSITGVQLLAQPFADIAQLDAGGITLPVLYLLLAALAIWFVLEHTATGRRLYATGFNADGPAAGVRTDRLRFLTLVASALLSGFAGCRLRVVGRIRIADRGHPVSAVGLRRRVRRGDPVPRGPLQRLGHRPRGPPARHGHHGTRARHQRPVGREPVHRFGPHRGAGPHGWPDRPAHRSTPPDGDPSGPDYSKDIR